MPQGEKRKILITTDLYTTNTNGVVTSVQNLFDVLTERGHDVRILTISADHHSHKDGAVYYIRSLPMGAVYPDVRMPVSFRHRLIQEIIDWKPDVIHSQCEFFSFQFASRISRITGAPIVHTYHTLYEQYVTYLVPSRRVGRTLVRVLTRERLKKVKMVVAPTVKVENALHGYGVENPISVVPSGICLEQHHKRLSSEERLRRRRALGIRDDQRVLLNLGRLGTEKNLGELMELFAQALKDNGNMVFLIVGDGPARKALEAQAARLGISDKVIFTGMVEPGQVQNYYQLADVFASASTSETQGLTYAEALAAGVPVLCRADPCLLGVVRDGENGWQYHSEEEFRQRLEDFLAHPQHRETLARCARETGEEYSAQRFAERVEAIYSEQIQRGSPRRIPA